MLIGGNVNKLMARQSSSVVDPSSIFGASLLAWYLPSDPAYRTTDAGAPNTTISALVNRASPGTGDLAQGTKANQPRLNSSAINGYDTYWADSTTKRMFSNAITVSGSTYLAIVAKVNSYNNNYTIINALTNGNSYWTVGQGGISFVIGKTTGPNLGVDVPGAGTLAQQGFSTGTFRLWEADATPGASGSVSTRINGGAPTTTAWNSSAISSNRIVVGSEQVDANAFALLAEWPEAVLASSLPTTDQRAALLAYFQGKYGI